MKSTKYYSSIQESLIAKYLDWDVVTGSGARDCHPGDIVSNEWLGECKTHVSAGKKITFNWDVWNKISNEASAKFRFPVLFVDDGSQKLANTWCLFPYHLLACSSSTIIEYKSPAQAHIVFEHQTMLERYKSLQKQYNNDLVILAITFRNLRLGIVPLTTFRELFGGCI